jgi:hypothetical protein
VARVLASLYYPTLYRPRLITKIDADFEERAGVGGVLRCRPPSFASLAWGRDLKNTKRLSMVFPLHTILKSYLILSGLPKMRAKRLVIRRFIA